MLKSSLSLSESRKQYFILVLVAGCLIGVVGFGPRSALGLFLPPMSGFMLAVPQFTIFPTSVICDATSGTIS